MAEAILVVDDDEGLLEVCEVGLRHAGYEVTSCASGEQALTLIESRSFDLVLADMMLPGRAGGHEVVLGVKARRPATEVIVMTATPSLKTAIATLKDGAYDYVAKPFAFDDLLATVRRCLDHRKVRQDLTSERALRQELESAYQEIQKVERLKQSFLARISHEIKTPLSELLMAFQLLEGELAKVVSGNEGQAARRYMELAGRGARRLERTLTDLVAFVDLQKQPAAAAKSDVDLEALCGEALARLKPMWEPRRLAVSLAFEPGTRPVSGDAGLLANAFEHLVHNAVVFNREGGAVAVRGRMKEGLVEVTVADTGEGIPASEFDNIFDSFYQIAHYLTRKVEGLGLGLAITRRIIEGHSGHISVASRLGTGTTFTVLLPPAEEK